MRKGFSSTDKNSGPLGCSLSDEVLCEQSVRLPTIRYRTVAAEQRIGLKHPELVIAAPIPSIIN